MGVVVRYGGPFAVCAQVMTRANWKSLFRQRPPAKNLESPAAVMGRSEKTEKMAKKKDEASISEEKPNQKHNQNQSVKGGKGSQSSKEASGSGGGGDKKKNAMAKEAAPGNKSKLPFHQHEKKKEEKMKEEEGKKEEEVTKKLEGISNGLKEMVEHERGKLLKLRGELESINNPLGYQKFREEEAVKEEIIDALQAVYEAKNFTDKDSLEGVLKTLQDDYEDTGKKIVSKALSRRRARSKAILAIENELKRERRKHAKRQLKLVVLVAGFTYLVNKLHRDKRFRRNFVERVRRAYSSIVPHCSLAIRWPNQRRKAVLHALGPQRALPSRKNSASSPTETAAVSSSKTGNKKIVEEAAAKDSGAKKSNGKGVARVEEEGEDDTELFFSSFNEDAREKVVKRLPSAFFCPITKEVMKYPVIAADGHTYEREAIKKWLHEHKTSPTTNLVLRHTHVIPNHSLKSAIQEYEER